MPYSTFKDNLPGITNRIITGSRRINRIIKELLVFARNDSEMIMELVDVRKVLKSAETLLANTIKKSTDNFVMRLDSSCPMVRANYLRVEQVVINIVQNACQALASPSKKIEIETYFRSETNEVVIMCRDEGVGISEENLTRVTEPFFYNKEGTIRYRAWVGYLFINHA